VEADDALEVRTGTRELQHGRATEAEADPTKPGSIDLGPLTQHLERGVGPSQQHFVTLLGGAIPRCDYRVASQR
jgi:hypothetical protein